MSIIDTGEYLDWPRVKVRTLIAFQHSNSKQREDSLTWLKENNITFVDSSIHVSYMFFYRYIKDPNYMTMFRLKFPELCCDHLEDNSIVIPITVGPAATYSDIDTTGSPTNLYIGPAVTYKDDK